MKPPFPYMTEPEWIFLKSHLNENDTMLEYGCGYSTLNIAPLVKELWSVEHDKNWFNSVVKLTENINNVKIFHVPQDKPRSSPTKLEEFQTYVDWIKDKDIKFNKVLIDGRARQWCAESIIEKLAPYHMVFVHDYSDKRPYYKRIENFYNIVGRKQTMVAFVKKS
jgi:hypothetical protein